MITHQNLSSALHHQAPLLAYTPSTRILDFSSYSFDVSIANLFRALFCGGCLCVPSDADRLDDLASTINRLRANVAHLTPSVARLLRPEDVPGLSRLHLGGEPVCLADVEPWWEAGSVRVLAGYGPSECTAASTICRPPASPADLVACLGSGAGLVTWVVHPDDHDRLLPPGCVGELLLEGPLVGRGYLADPVRTEAVFIRDPVWLARPARLYKTGDLVRQKPDGSLLFVGRNDTQVKIRGQRVELAEVELRVRQLMMADVRGPVVAEVVVHGCLPSLAVFLLLNSKDSSSSNISSSNSSPPCALLSVAPDVRDSLAARLPAYMVPTLFFSVSELPMTAAGKTDRRRLREMGAAVAAAQRQAVAEQQPTSSLELKLQHILARVLGLETACVGPQDCFFRLGGDSLRAIKVVAAAREAGVRLAVADLYSQSPASIQNLARVASGSRSKTVRIDLMAEIDRHDAMLIASSSSLLKGVVNGHDPSRHPLTVLVTGANGFIGTQILRQLLDHRLVSRVIGLVRGSTASVARARTVAAAVRAGWWSDVYEDKLDVWAGDLTLPRLGLDVSRWDTLSTTVDVVIHNGARVHFVASYRLLEAANVSSTLELLKLTGKIRIVYVSTARRRDPSEESDEEVALELAGNDDVTAYSQTKFVAEALVRRAAVRRPPDRRHAVVSPGFVIGTPTEGVANADDFLWRLAAACIRTGAYNEDEASAWIPLSDAASAAGAMVKAAVGEETSPLVTQVKGGMTLSDVWAVLIGMGYQLKPSPSQEWLAAVMADMEAQGDKHPLRPLVHLVHVSRADVRWADSWREDSVAAVRLKAAVRRSAEFLVGAGFLPRPASTETEQDGRRTAGVAFSRTGR
ncbi:hypothetical protein CDD80_5882 [Ophiocordyceps camponoti-rufipedis]|uniref:Carrier domain-containing protein n=1 Tax=Ophiocordyceps camponoti-rufipedis TaxID=2004952 RepID=A0A2C5YPD5_9HYPO|nr:hypothetical protein CDD80_5882 [Ophiocordyceps camponoti-rufipedis]